MTCRNAVNQYAKAPQTTWRDLRIHREVLTASTSLALKRVGTEADTAAITEDTWNSRELPVIQAAVDIHNATDTYLTRASAIGERTGLDHDTVQRALRRLNSQPSSFEKVVEASGGEVIMVGPPTADALRVAGAWPSPEMLLRRLINALETAADDDARDPEERSKLRLAATYLGSFATQVAIGALGGAGGNVLSS
jgi:hypothetical protein